MQMYHTKKAATRGILSSIRTLVLGEGAKGLVTGGCRGGRCEQRPAAALCRGQAVPASPKTDPLRGTAESISQDGGISGKMHLTKGKILCRQ